MGKVERAAYLLQHSLCVCHAAGDEEATSAVFIGNEWRWRRARRVGEKSYALCAMDAQRIRDGCAADRRRLLSLLDIYVRLGR
jgi:hypothetical protein